MKQPFKNTFDTQLVPMNIGKGMINGVFHLTLM